ncbi:TIR-like protein FxsC [Streptomyces blattellae]|uniref:TIR-like protein FxsC n=1 Tax=Streptomyces blattellae TaxID=2569855 RepID=UPI0012B96E0D|nr:TIR-like protein FxsC [Streptomyces blattellae]
MPDGLDRLLAALVACVPDGTDARDMADAVWLAAARSADAGPVAAAASEAPEPAAVEPAPPEAPPDPAPPPGAAPPDPGVSARTPGSGDRVRGTPLSVGRADALPETLAVGRALRPFRRTWRGGGRTRLDIDATVDHFARGGPLVPLFSPRPERRFEVVALVDTSLSMSVWHETARTLTRLLGGLGAFRTVSTWEWTWADAQPLLRDHRGTPVPPDRVPHHGSGAHGRRLLLVFSDCAARGWHGPAPWRLLGDWGRRVPVVLVDPLPPRLWRRSALDLPAVRATAAVPGGRNSTLRHRLPLRWRPHPGRPTEPGPWQALPVATCTPYSLGRWASTLMGSDPQGCDAVLVPAAGRLPRAEPADAEPAADPASLADAFLRTGSAPAVRLAILSSHLPEITLPLLHALRAQAVPEARLSDLAELLTSGLLTVTRVPGHDPVLAFREPARSRLGAHLTTHDAWQTLRALTRHLETHPHAPHGIAAVLHSPGAIGELPAQLQPFAHATLATRRRLGISDGGSGGAEEAGERLPDLVHIVEFGRITELSGGSHVQLTGAGVLLAARLVLAATPPPLPGQGPLVAMRSRGHGERDRARCRQIWRSREFGVALYLTEAGIAGPVDATPTPAWAEPAPTAPPVPCRTVVSPAPGEPPSFLTGVLHGDVVGFEPAAPQPLSVPPGAPVFHGSELLGLARTVVREPGEPDRLSVVGIGDLARDRGFMAEVNRHLPQPPRLRVLGAAPPPAAVPKRPARFLIGNLPRPWLGGPSQAAALARDWEDTAGFGLIVLGGESAAEKRSYAASAVRREWDERRVDLVVWVTGSSTAGIRARYAEAEAVIAGTDTAGTDDGVRAFFDRLRSMTRPWIVVVDGLDEVVLPDEVRPPLTTYGRVVVTGTGPRLRAPTQGGTRSRRRRRLGLTDSPYFFLSWAGDESAPYVMRFYDDLVAELRDRDADLRAQPPFRDLEHVKLAADWAEVLGRAVGFCRTFVALYSPSYFRSWSCGREFAAFSDRLTRYRELTDVDARALVPVQWAPPAVSLPDAAARYQLLDPGQGEPYAQHGLLELLRTEPSGEPYRRVVQSVADAVHRAAEVFHLPIAPDLDLNSVPSAFPGQQVSERSAHARVFVTPDASSLAPRVQRVITEEGLTTSVHLIDGSLARSLHRAEQLAQICILIVDPRSLSDTELRAALLAFDGRNHPLTGVIVPWEHDEGFAQDDEALWDGVREVFSRNWVRRNDPHEPLFRIRVTSERLDEVLAVMVAVAVNRLIDATPPRRLPTGPLAPPLPGLASPRRAEAHDE